MNRPLVSIIIPVFNAEKFIAQTIQSAINQTWSTKEIIIVDDGSTDNSLAIAKQYENECIKVFSQQNSGAGKARNLGLQIAVGDYIQFLDADDLLNNKKIESQVLQLMEYPGYIGVCSTIHFLNGTDPSGYSLKHEWFSKGSDDPADFLIKLYGGDLVGPSYGGMIQPNAWLTPRTLIDKAGIWNEFKCPDDDGEFFCRVILASKGIKFSDTGINYYRKFTASNSLSAQKSREAYENTLLSVDLKYQYLKAQTNNPILKKIFARHYWEIGVAAYPQYKALSKKAISKAVEYNFKGKKYKAGPVSTFLSKIFGWRLARIFDYYRHGS